MKSLTYCVLFSIALLSVSCSGTTEKKNQSESAGGQIEESQENATASEEKKKPASPKMDAMAMVGSNHIHIDYSSPSVRGRVIWGGLVAYNRVWSTGAHKATAINFPEAVIVNGNTIPAGKYGFFTIPGEDSWTLILNKKWNMHLADDYDESEDIMRFEVTPLKLENIQEALTYQVESTGDNVGNISMAWEYLKISFEFTNK